MAVRNDILSQFNLGHMTIEDRARADACYWALLKKISVLSAELHYLPEDLVSLPTLLTDTYFCNLSIFQSLPDHWAIGQVFPVMPVHRLDEEPTRPVVIGDITCDSDGKIDKFPDLKDVKRYLMAHNLKDGEPYYFAAFLVGAYQEILGDLHNLFGDTNAVHLNVKEDGQVEFSSIIEGDTIEQVLKYVAYQKGELCQRWRSAIEQAVSEGKLEASESAELFKKFSNAFESYTYLDNSRAD